MQDVEVLHGLRPGGVVVVKSGSISVDVNVRRVINEHTAAGTVPTLHLYAEPPKPVAPEEEPHHDDDDDEQARH